MTLFDAIDRDAPPDDNEPEALRKIAARRRTFLRATLTWLLLVGPVGGVLNSGALDEVALDWLWAILLGGVAAYSTVALWIAASRLADSTCPRCGNPYFSKAWWGEEKLGLGSGFWSSHFRSLWPGVRCRHCRTRLY